MFPRPRFRVEAIASVQRRRHWSVAEKVRLFEEAFQPGRSVSFVARRAVIAPSQLFAWKRRMAEGGQAAMAADENFDGASKVRDLERKVRELERLLGKKTIEAEILREALDAARAKNRPCRSCGGRGGCFPMSCVAKTLGIARSNLAERKKGAIKPRGRFRKAADAELTPLSRAIVDERPTYGYRRICAQTNRKFRTDGKPPVNAKRVLRITQNNGLTLERYTARRPGLQLL